MAKWEHAIPETVNTDLQKERDGASFDREEFAVFWNDGAEQLKFKRQLKEEVFKDLNQSERDLLPYKSHEELYDLSVKYAINLSKKLRKLQDERNPGGNEFWPTLYSSNELWPAMPVGNPFGVQFLMLVEALKTHATDEQYEEFGKRIEDFDACGTYAQTEMGHGTFLRGLETRADFDRKTDEFVLNSPSLTAFKWWPGGLGHSSNYCLLVAQLYIDNIPKGVHMFYVQLRDENTHLPLPGIHVGEIGKKMGFLGVNNGFLGLQNVRIPRNRMLMRHAKLMSDGTYVKSPQNVLTYFTMVYVRCTIARTSCIILALASTIATRYSAVRRQSPINPEEAEPQIIDHVTQQLKLFPEIATSIAYMLTSRNLWTLYDRTKADIENGDYVRLPELHSLACCIKVLSSFDSSTGVERLRLACGGHGYLTSTNLGPLYTSATAACTYEGENTVLQLQAARFLIKSWRAALTGEHLAPTVAYLADVQKRPDFGRWTGTWDNLVSAMKYAAANKVGLVYRNLETRLKNGESEGEAFNSTGIQLTQAAELHGRVFIFDSMVSEITGPNSKQRSAALNRVLKNILELYLVNTTLQKINEIFRFVNLTESDLNALQTRLEVALRNIRPDAIAIVDGFDFTDEQLNSTIGSFDGNVYERIFDAALKSPLNQLVVPKSFHSILGPFLKSKI